MKLYSENKDYKLYQGNMLDMLEVIEPNTIDSVVCDPPYELNFMGKGWDNSGIAFQPDTWKKCYEVLKPGGYLLAFGGSRTFHRIACAIEDAGFEIRDTIMWLYGSGFPKSMNIGLQFDKREGLQGQRGIGGFNVGGIQEQQNRKAKLYIGSTTDGSKQQAYTDYKGDLARKWQGWGTALKPSFEPIIVARKPFKGSLVDNVIEYGVGGINIDECRVGTETIKSCGGRKNILTGDERAGKSLGYNAPHEPLNTFHDGRFPANTILTYDETDFDEVCGGFPISETHSMGNKETAKSTGMFGVGNIINMNRISSKGSASRYFMNCKYTGKDEEIWKQLFVNNVENNLEILKATKDNIAQMNVRTLLKELKDHYAKYVDNQLDLIETPIVQDIVEMLTWDFKIGTSKVMQDFITNYKKCIQFLNLVQFVEKMDNIDTTQTTQNLLKLFGYVKVVITNYIQGNIEYDQKRYIYTPKASKKDRDEGLEEFEEKNTMCDRNPELASANMPQNRSGNLRKNTHPTVKPTELMQYLVRLVMPNGGTILDPFNGSGSTGKAVMYENKERDKGYKYIGIELTEEYLPISKARIEYVCNLKEDKLKDKQMSIFDIGESNE